MTAILRRATPNDFDAICELLHTYMNPAFSIQRWRALFTHGWCSGKPDFGIVADDNGAVVGFHGHICSHRIIDGYWERFTNFTSWYIRKEYRKNGLGSKMLEMATADPETTYTVFSLSPKRIEFFKSLGMNVLDEERLLWRKQGKLYDNLELIVDPVKIRAQSAPYDLPFFDDHIPLRVMPVLVATRCAQCLLLLARAVKNDRVYYDVLYRSNPALFTQRVQDIAEALLPDSECVLAADRRFVDDDGPGAEVEVIKSPRFYKSSRVEPRDIDLTYSELSLLGLKLD
ncbi:GNAT family N-acetyltransferase [Pseudodesulfovibrio sp. JC047]|uniref:GNAT family N-acetyltransferase n=1 Tax=Pseudodesulfovibrio sp. JC047 TaxID=2683199 RepID=UPI0013D1054C|nr:GNAT family N-acetyltransferase [Pseudodesulfovibrio sp. JC047]NDV20458.1 GNAT family N-acetyltransferase [Pseudodesulfovibrio sp. JC047]